MEKTVLPMTADHCLMPENVDNMVKTLVLECSRPADRLLPVQVGECFEAAA